MLMVNRQNSTGHIELGDSEEEIDISIRSLDESDDNNDQVVHKSQSGTPKLTAIVKPIANCTHTNTADKQLELNPGYKRRRMLASTGILALLLFCGIVVLLTINNSPSTNHTNAETTGDQQYGTTALPSENESTSNSPPTVPISLPPIPPPPLQPPQKKVFLSMQVNPDESTTFILHKSVWNHSFVVYPTVERHSAPVTEGYERGSILLDTNDNAFHFERDEDPKFLLLISENHRVRLQENSEESFKSMFEDNHWQGYMTKVAIFMETHEAYHFSTDPFISVGFFVSEVLMTSQYTIHGLHSQYYPRNTNLQVEYDLGDSVLIVTYHIGLLPVKVMPQRHADDRVGYFSIQYQHYSSDDNVVDGFHQYDPLMTILTRWSLERNDITNETTNPITYYIDPSIPKRWHNAFVAGIEAWLPAFENIGFKHAIKAVLPGDKDWPHDYRLGDFRYNSISAMISDEIYAIGSSVIDPRSGEILHSNILFEYGFFDAVMSDFDLLSPVSTQNLRRVVPSSDTKSTKIPHNRRKMQQCGLASHENIKLDRFLLAMGMGETNPAFVPDYIIEHQFTSIIIHEVGHTLGLRHNFAGSASVSRANLNDDTYVRKHGLSTSIMDYIPVNIYSDLTEKAAKTHGYYMVSIGAYDYHAIAYGYSVIKDEIPGILNKELSLMAQNTPLFLTDEDEAQYIANPYGQKFDLSSNPLDHANDRLDLVKSMRAEKLLQRLPDDASWSVLWRRESALLKMIQRTIYRVTPFIGGMNITHVHRSHNEKSLHIDPISKIDQIRALDVLGRIIRAEEGLFPDPKTYSMYIKVGGFPDEDCNEPTLEYGCQAREMVDLDEVILTTRQIAISEAMFPALYRIITQDVNSPLQIHDILNYIGRAVFENSTIPRNFAVKQFYLAILYNILDTNDEDPRLYQAVESYLRSNSLLPT